jgi:hypothetical protein
LGLRLGIEDPEQWLEDCPERVFDNWLAYYRLEPFGLESELLSKIIGLLFYLCRKQGGELEDIDKFVSAVSRCVMPGNWVGQSQVGSQEKLTAEELKKRFAAAQKMAEKAFG